MPLSRHRGWGPLRDVVGGDGVGVTKRAAVVPGYPVGCVVEPAVCSNTLSESSIVATIGSKYGGLQQVIRVMRDATESWLRL